MDIILERECMQCAVASVLAQCAYKVVEILKIFGGLQFHHGIE